MNPSPSRPRRRDSEPPGLTPYRARLEVEMDDTAVSKVRDPSVSISLDVDEILPLPEARKSSSPLLEPVYSVALGTVFGAMIVALIVFIVRSISR